MIVDCRPDTASRYSTTIRFDVATVAPGSRSRHSDGQHFREVTVDRPRTIGRVRHHRPGQSPTGIVPRARVAQMLESRSDVPAVSKRYGLGFWLQAAGPAVMLEGMDAGVSFHSRHDAGEGFTWTVVSNTTDGAWPIARHLSGVLPI